MNLNLNTAFPSMQTTSSMTTSGPLEISGPMGTAFVVQMIPFTEDQQLVFFAAAALQGLRASRDQRESPEIAAQAYTDAVAMVNAIKQAKAVTEALTKEQPQLKHSSQEAGSVKYAAPFGTFGTVSKV